MNIESEKIHCLYIEKYEYRIIEDIASVLGTINIESEKI